MNTYRVRFLYRKKVLSPSIDVDRKAYIIEENNIDELEEKIINHAKEVGKTCDANVATAFLDQKYDDEIVSLASYIIKDLDKEAIVEKLPTTNYPGVKIKLKGGHHGK